jgi:hypothetical protein
MTTKRFEILEVLPTYGPMYVPVSENVVAFYSEGFLVCFNKADLTGNGVGIRNKLGLFAQNLFDRMINVEYSFFIGIFIVI